MADERDFPKRPILSVGFLYNMALEIKFPFQAITLIIDCALLLKANTMNFSVMKGLH